MEYAVIRVGGKQYKVSEGDLLTLDKTNFEGKKTITFDDVLLTNNGLDQIIGKPSVSGASVVASFVEDKKGDKIRVSKFKAKSRYRKTIGFRAQQTVVKIDKIGFGAGKTTKETSKSTKTAPKSKNK